MKVGKYLTCSCASDINVPNVLLMSGFFQMPLHETCCKYTAFISFRGIYEWTRVPMGLLSSAYYFQKSMSLYVLNDLLYKMCEVYIDDMLILGSDDDNLSQTYGRFFSDVGKRPLLLTPRNLRSVKTNFNLKAMKLIPVVSICPRSVSKVQLLSRNFPRLKNYNRFSVWLIILKTIYAIIL